MRYFVIYLTFCLLVTGCSQQKVKQDWIIIETYESGMPRIKRSLDLNADGCYSYRELYPSGKLKLTGNWKDEKRVGLWKSFYEENEQLWSFGDYVNGVRHGRSVIYHENGIIMMTGFYANGKMDSIWINIDKNGDTLNVAQYRDGMLVFNSSKTLVAPLR